jgi:hypothetical protein
MKSALMKFVALVSLAPLTAACARESANDGFDSDAPPKVDGGVAPHDASSPPKGTLDSGGGLAQGDDGGGHPGDGDGDVETGDAGQRDDASDPPSNPPDSAATSCMTNADCSGGSTSGAVCLRPFGNCNAQGICVAGGGCNAQSGPMCGCDGITYPSACDAYAADVGLKSTGDCDTSQRDQ